MPEVELLAFVMLIFAIGVINFGFLRNSFVPYKLSGAFLWVIPLVWIMISPVAPFTAGTALQTVIMLVLIGITLISLFGAFSRPLQINSSQTVNGTTSGRSEEGSGWHLPKFMQNTSSYQYQKQQRRMDLNEYRDRAHNAVFPRRNRR